MRIEADLHTFNSQVAEPLRFSFANQQPVGLQLHAEHQLAGVTKYVEDIFTNERFATADHQEKSGGMRQLLKNFLDFGQRHFAAVVVIEVAMHAPLVAAVGDVKMRAQRHAKIERALRGFLKNRGAHAASSLFMGDSETRKTPAAASSVTNASASAKAVAGSISKTERTFSSTILRNGVLPSAPSQIREPTSLREKMVESGADMIRTSVPRTRAASFEPCAI